MFSNWQFISEILIGEISGFWRMKPLKARLSEAPERTFRVTQGSQGHWTKNVRKLILDSRRLCLPPVFYFLFLAFPFTRWEIMFPYKEQGSLPLVLNSLTLGRARAGGLKLAASCSLGRMLLTEEGFGFCFLLSQLRSFAQARAQRTMTVYATGLEAIPVCQCPSWDIDSNLTCRL